MSFLLKNNELLEKFNEIWDKVSKIIKKKFDSAPIYIEKYLRTKMISYEGKVSTNFNKVSTNVNKIPKEGSQYICLSVILIDSVF